MTAPDPFPPLSVTAERTVPLPAAEVYEAWTAGFDRWFAATGTLRMRPEVGAPFYFETEHPEGGRRHPHYGRFLRLVPHRLVELTWVTGAGGTEGAETVVTLELIPEESGTRVRLTHSGFPNAAARERHAGAWPYVLEQMERKLSAGKTGGSAHPPALLGLDHIVLTVRDVATTAAFYTGVLGMRAVSFAEGRTALAFGNQKINLHPCDHPFAPHAAHPAPGSADLCFLTETPLASVAAHVTRRGVAIETGPVERTGATGRILSVYLRDPDGNLIEISNRLSPDEGTSDETRLDPAAG